MSRSDETIEIRWDLWWVWWILYIVVGLAAYGLVMFFVRWEALSLIVAVCCALLAPVAWWFAQRPPLTGRITPEHLELGNQRIPWSDIDRADVFHTRVGGLQFHAGIRFTESGRKKHASGFSSTLTDFDISVAQGQCAMGVQELADEINSRVR